MIKVYAFEPEAICDPKLVQALESFGFEHGRLIGCVPKEWRRQIGELYHSKFPQDKDLDIALERLAKKKAIQRVRLPVTECNSWIKKACAVDGDFLHGIICTSTSNENGIDPRVISRGDINDDNLIWKQESGIREFRDPKAMAEKARILLRYASEVKFIDPYFAGEKSHTDFVVECVKTLKTWRKATRLPLEIHFHFQPSANEDLESRTARSLQVFNTIFHKTLVALSKQEMELSLFQWTIIAGGDRFHERTVVTDCGSIEFGGGLGSGNPNEKTSVKLMSSSATEALRKAFRDGSEEYKLLHHRVVSQGRNK